MLKTAADSGLSIDWGAFGLVLVASLVAALVIVAFFSIALRLLATGTPPMTGPGSAGSAAGASPRNPLAVVAAVVCIAICVAAVLYGLYLVIPIFHAK